ncbi:piggyBac transposable element-derived protein 4-like isoform X2 [Antennarius striatus]
MERKLSEQNRKRSSTLDAEMQGKSTESESEIPAKKRRPSQSEDGQENEEATKMSSLVHRDAERDVEDGKENTDDSVVKAKRKREEKEEEKLKIGEEVIPSRVLSKKELLMDEDRTQEMSLKKCIDKIDSKDEKTEALGDPTADEKSYKGEKTTSQGPHFTSGVIMKITDSKPLPGRKFIKEALCRLSPVAYVDILEGDSEGHVRFHTPEEAKAVSDAGGELQMEHSWKLEILSGDDEQRYWQKILVDRQVEPYCLSKNKWGTEESPEGNEAHSSDDDMSGEDSPWSQEDSGEEYLPDEEEAGDFEEEEGEEVEGAVEYYSSQWRSRNGEILWSPSHEEAKPFVPPPILTPGPTAYAAARIRSPEDAFDLFFPDEILQIILRSTNLQGRRSVNDWKDLNEEELHAYLGLLILAGVFKARHESTRGLWDNETGRPVFAAAMSENRFVQIGAVLCFDDALSRTGRHRKDELAPIRDLWDRWSSRLSKMFHPGRDVCIDEQLLPFRGHCSFRQYMPTKRAHYGLKLWALCDVQTSYAWKLQVHLENSGSALAKHNQGMHIVLELTDELKGHTVTTDKFVTSFPLAEALKKRKITLVGMLRSDKPELPPQLLNITHREVRSSVFAFTRNKTVVSYIPKKKKNLLLLSTRHWELEVQQSVKNRPQIVVDYNRCKGAAEHLERACGTYTCRRQTRSWDARLFYHMIDVSCFNAFILFTAVDADWNSNKAFKRRVFLEQLGRALIAPAIINRSRLPRGSFAASVVLQAQVQQEDGGTKEEEPHSGPSKSRKACILCSNKKKRVWSQCSTCGGHACKIHLSPICHSCLS